MVWGTALKGGTIDHTGDGEPQREPTAPQKGQILDAVSTETSPSPKDSTTGVPSERKSSTIENGKEELTGPEGEIATPMDVEQGDEAAKQSESQESKSGGNLDQLTSDAVMNASEGENDVVDGINLSRTISEEPVPSPVRSQKVYWKKLSQVARKTSTSIQPTRFHGLDENKINRVKMVLYSAGSQVHRGKGFERIFAEYWDAVCLRLSDRLSSHTFERCEKAIATFLTSKKLRRVHNRFIMGTCIACKIFSLSLFLFFI